MEWRRLVPFLFKIGIISALWAIIVLAEWRMEISYTELRSKEVVNVNNGARMGKIIDMIIDSNGKNVLGLVVPGVRKIFRAAEDIFIPWRNITKIGSDVILVCIDACSLTNVARSDSMDLSGCRNEKSCADDYL